MSRLRRTIGPGGRWPSAAVVTTGVCVLLAAGCGKGTISAPPGAAGSGGMGTPQGSGGRSTGGSGSGGTSGGGVGTGGGVAVNVPSIGATLDCPKANLGKPVLRLLTRNEIQNTLLDVFPEAKGKWTSGLPAPQLLNGLFDNDGSNEVGNDYASGMLDTALAVADAMTGAAVLPGVLPCAAAAADRACAETFVGKYGRRLFRRALTDAERTRYLTFFDASLAKSDFKTALKYTLAGLIQSPNAIYRSEIGTVKSDGTRQLSPTEVATALAYTYTGSTPTDDLLTQAESGALGDPVTVARSLLATDAGKASVQRFFEQYVGYASVGAGSRPNIPNFSSLSGDMAAETRAFIADVVIAKGGGVKELLTATTTNPSKALASFYGFPAPAADFATIDRPANRGVGLLAQGAFLATNASPDSTSPTHRGLFPFYRLLCQPKLMVPSMVPTIVAPQPGKTTTRQRYEDTHAKISPVCGSCHNQFDPIGFGFEHYDEGGRYRDTEGGLPIDTSGAVPKDATSKLFTFNGEEELMKGLVASPTVHQCVAAHLAAYAFGTTDSCLNTGEGAALQSGSIGLVEAYARLAGEPHFTARDGH